MADILTSAERSERMARIRAKDTAPELRVRRLLHRFGYRFRLHRVDLPGCPDIVLPRHRTVIFVHGCFWHQHPDPACRRARLPKSRQDYWVPKLRRNAQRDAAHRISLERAGWRVLEIWECETSHLSKLEGTLRSVLGNSGL
ncbi:T/G mismatch-specific endonuclease [Rhizorhabdus wittichii RW1]|uniref:Very short patch repair endonuclease n=1 Tax=Rhizorhabdus wittichii (strain DSM 6014 / CCUG 31198 / JCM 15750 / NBRC 105917 / EY 4224 / RW1) TaxID=392499 RepID=A0A9J9HC59_RHIWR|nr:T/G mismatch-specific endonuclease [Rhizorhabdus wittichii RW1]